MKTISIAIVIVVLVVSCTTQEDKKSNDHKETTENQAPGNNTGAKKITKQISVSGTSIMKNVDKAEFATLIAKVNGTILDVRTPDEFGKGNIEGSINIDIYDNTFVKKAKEIDSKKPIYIYCQSGGRSGRAMGELKKLGFSEVYNLKGGYGGWIKE
ncbi:MAG: rhodanese-related sulfurtransferase [Patiriisocius sp.]|jgi:rhodanese-related sulfurtransferase